MGYKLAEDHVRVRTTFGWKWIWELITADGHIAASAGPFENREQCEASARAQSLPIIGGRRVVKGPRAGSRRPGARVYSNGSGVWMWKVLRDDGSIAAASTTGFLSREECERDLMRELGAEHACSESVPRGTVRPVHGDAAATRNALRSLIPDA